MAIDDVKPILRELAKYAIAKKGAQQCATHVNFDVLELPCVEVMGASWGTFFEEASHRHVRLPVLANRLKTHQEKQPLIKLSEWVARDGHIYMEVPLDAGLPLDYLQSLIDEAHQVVWNKLDESARLNIELAGLPYDERSLLDRLIELRGLGEHRKVIHQIARPAILMRTRRSSETKIPVGAAKLGGRPDLPPDVDWPTYRDGKPLAFLAQLDLAEVDKFGSPIQGLPSIGLLSLFSAWGWMEEGDGDPHPPEEDLAEQAGYTAILHTPAGANLERRKTPRTVNSFKAAAVELLQVLSLPNHRQEPPLAALDWTDELYGRFDGMQSDFRSLQMGHLLKISDSMLSHHLLGGYALFQQEYPEELLGMNRAMIMQVGSDGNTGMGWGDGGELTFYADAAALAHGRFERVWGTCQCG